MKPTYHRPPNFSTPPPPEGPFHLGTIIRDFKRREQMRPLNQDEEGRVSIKTAHVYRDHKGGFEATRGKLRSGAVGIWAQFLGISGLGAEASISVEQSDNDVYKFDSVDTEYFFPTAAYIAQCVEMSDVKDYLEGTDYKKPVYLVTGLKVAKGVSVQLEKARKLSGRVEVGYNDPTGQGASVGPRVEGAREDSTGMAFTESSDLVVGIQCVKLYYRSSWLSGERKLKDEMYTSGATFVDDDNEPRAQQATGTLIPAGPEDRGPPGDLYRADTADGGDDEAQKDIWACPVEPTQ